MSIRIGDEAQDSRRDDEGSIRFHGGSATMGNLFSTQDFTPVCTTEFGYRAA